LWPSVDALIDARYNAGLPPVAGERLLAAHAAVLAPTPLTGRPGDVRAAHTITAAIAAVHVPVPLAAASPDPPTPPGPATPPAPDPPGL